MVLWYLTAVWYCGIVVLWWVQCGIVVFDCSVTVWRVQCAVWWVQCAVWCMWYYGVYYSVVLWRVQQCSIVAVWQCTSVVLWQRGI